MEERTRGGAAAAAAAAAPEEALGVALAAGVLAHVALVRRFRVRGAAEFAALVALLALALAAAAGLLRAPRGLRRLLEPFAGGGGEGAEPAGPPAADAAADAAGVDPPSVDVLGALNERVVPSMDQLVVSFRKASSMLGEDDPDKLGIVVPEDRAGGQDGLLAMKRADYFLCKTQNFTPDGYARLVKALVGKAGGYAREDEPPMPPPMPRTDGEAGGEGGEGGEGGGGGGGQPRSMAELRRMAAARQAQEQQQQQQQEQEGGGDGG